MVSVTLKNVVKRFGNVEVLKGISFHVNDGEMFFLLGPSGCGKTTTLRIIAGFYVPDEGEVYFGDKLMNNVPPHKRNIGMVFQNYALWPHMKVYDNIAYGLKLRGLPKREIDKRVREVLKLVKLEGHEDKYPSQLSGGQQQRVALARALVVEPEVLLLDEPLSNLDAKLRIEMRREIRRIQKELKITAIYVTHDQSEALSMADRIAVMNFGVIEQIGTPREIYTKPKTRFVADFIGEANFIEGVVLEYKDGAAIVETHFGTRIKAYSAVEVSPGDKVAVVVRPERTKIARSPETVPAGMNVIEAKVAAIMYYGSYEDYILSVEDKEYKARVFAPRERIVSPGEKVYMYFSPEDGHIVK